MNRNQKIAIGCGAAGCLGLIFLVIIGAAGYFLMRSRSPAAGIRTTNFNRNPSRNSNSNSPFESNSNSDSNGSSGDEGKSSMADDDKHKLFQAAGGTQDSEIMQRVLRKFNFIKEDGSSTDEYAAFLKDHITWAVRNLEFIQSVSTPEKARAYVEAHIND